MRSVQHNLERNVEELRRLAQREDNKFCFDCNIRGPLYIVMDYNIYVCTTCSSFHREMQHRVKGISMSAFTDEEMQDLRLGGNGPATKVWLADFSRRKPSPGNASAIRCFLSATFQRRLFMKQDAGNNYNDNLDGSHRRHLHNKKSSKLLKPAGLRHSTAPTSKPKPTHVVLPPAPTLMEAASEPHAVETVDNDSFTDFFVAQPDTCAPSPSAVSAHLLTDLFSDVQQGPAPSQQTDISRNSHGGGFPPFAGPCAPVSYPQPHQQHLYEHIAPSFPQPCHVATDLSLVVSQGNIANSAAGETLYGGGHISGSATRTQTSFFSAETSRKGELSGTVCHDPSVKWSSLMQQPAHHSKASATPPMTSTSFFSSPNSSQRPSETANVALSHTLHCGASGKTAPPSGM